MTARNSNDAEGPPPSERPPVFVSIVTPSFNSRAFIGATLRSVQRQTYGSIEHFVFDGGSTDGTLDVIEDFAHRHPLRWTSQPDDGMYDAVNRGMAETDGDIVAYLNSDDLLVPWAVEVVVEAFRANPEADVVFGDAIRWYPEIAAVDLMIQPDFDLGRVSRTGSLIQPTVFWRRRLVDRIGGFDSELRLAADLDFWLRAGQVATFVHVDEVVAIERIHSGGQSTRLRSAHGVEGKAVRQRYHADGRLRMVRKLVARLLNGVVTRRRMIEFARLGPTSRDSGWSHFRSASGSTVSLPGLVAALITPRPLSGARARSFQMLALRGRWIRVSEGFLEDVTRDGEA